MWVANKLTVIRRGQSVILITGNRRYRGEIFGVFYCNLSRLLRHEKPAILSEVTRSFHAIANPYFSVLTHNLG